MDLLGHADIDGLDGGVAGFAEGPRQGLGHALQIDCSAAQGVITRGQAGQQRRPVYLRQAHGPGARLAGVKSISSGISDQARVAECRSPVPGVRLIEDLRAGSRSNENC